MRFRMSFAGSAVCLIGLAFPASSQTSPAGSPTSQVSKTWEIGRSLSDQLDPFVRHVEHKYQRWDFLELNYVQQTEDRVAAAAGLKPLEIRIMGGGEWYGFLLPKGVLYVSAGLLEHASSEAELAGLLAHELGHANDKTAVEPFQQCVLATGYLPVQRRPRETERLATQRAINYMKASGYNPSAMLDLFSQISYENQRWSKAIVSGDLLSLRAALEAEAEPPGGYAIDSSEFARFHAKLAAFLGHSAPTIILRHRPDQ